ncbi:head GIN domain-containing protein [Microbacterium sp. B2969]|uniref:Head GIN domain-containing protein n=1 Tax=Microbacterium alkaliflavum TaxID=3248839 RepID=A0ABW7QD54_9MICO
MRTIHSLAVLGAAASVLVLSGCVPFIASGPMTSQDREVDAVTTVVLDSSGDLSISEGEPKLVVHAPEDALEHLTSDVEGDTLVLGVKPGFDLGLGKVRYELTLPALQAVELNGSGDVESTVSASGTVRLTVEGSGDVTWTGLDAERVEVGLSGSGDLELRGSATELEIQLDGSGSVDAEHLDTQNAVVAIGGSGDADVTASGSLSVDISGSGRVTYSGDPELDSNVSGSGEVVRR